MLSASHVAETSRRTEPLGSTERNDSVLWNTCIRATLSHVVVRFPDPGGLSDVLSHRSRDRPSRVAQTDGRDRGEDGDRRTSAPAVRQRSREDQARRDRRTERPSHGEVRRRDRDHPDPTRRGQDHDDRRPGPGDAARRQERRDLPAAAVDGPDVRDQGWRGRWWLQPGDPDGAAQPAPHRRLPRGDRGPQPAVGHDRQPPLPRERTRPRRRQHHLAPRDGRERSGVAQHRHRPRRQDGRRRPPDRFRHHGGVRGHGDLGAGDIAGRHAGTIRSDRRRLHPGRRTRHGRAAPRRRLDDGHDA